MKRLISVLLALCVTAGFALIASAEAPPGTFAPPENLGQLTAAEQLDYFNLVVNRVRAERPGFKQRQLMKIDEVEVSGFAAAFSSIINSVIQKLMPGSWEYKSAENGEDNTGLFLSENANASDLRPQDITSITSAKEGDFWVIEVRVADSVNPEPGAVSSVGRIAPIATREQVFAAIIGGGNDNIKADPANATLRYHSAYACVTVNPEGKVIFAESGYNALAQLNDAIVSVIKMDVTARQSAVWQCADFDWTAERVEFPPDPPKPPPPPPPPPSPWYSYLPACLQWILRWCFFGWIWMN